MEQLSASANGCCMSEKVGEVGRGKGSAEEHHAVALERECARDDPTAQRVGIVLGARDDDGRATGALGRRAEPDQQVIDGGARGVLVGNAQDRRPPTVGPTLPAPG